MFARYFFIILGIISLLWIGYVAADIIDKKNSYSPTLLFGKEDKQILIINRRKEVDLTFIPFKTTPKNYEILNAILPHIQDERSIYISAERRHFLIESKYNWSKSKVKQLLEKSGLKFESTGIRSFKISNYEISLHKHFLYFHDLQLKTTVIDGWSKFDHKSSATLIDLVSDSPVIKEIYFHGSDKVEFHTKNELKTKGNQVLDKDLFASVLPKDLNDYHFLEKNFAQSIDKVFAKGPMMDWVDKGYVSFDYDGKKVLISDFKIGQDPIQVLYEKMQEEETNEDYAFFNGIKLTEDFPSSAADGFYIFLLNDFVVISQDQAVCEEIVAQNKLGKTLATEPELLDRIYSGLPSRVSERFVSNKEKFSRTIYKTKILETRLTLKQSGENEEVENARKDMFSIKIDAVIQDFISFNGKGNVAVLTATGELMHYSNGKMTWIKNLGSKGVGEITYIEQFQFIMITCKNSIHLLDRQGNYVLGGPINLGNYHPVSQATHYEWKKKLYLVIADERGDIVVFDSKRRVFSVIKNSMPDIKSPVDVWVSQGKLFYGVHNSSTFKMFDAERKREHRSFPTPENCVTVIKDNEIMLYGTENGNLVQLDQKGTKQSVGASSGSGLKRTVGGRNDVYLINNNSRSIAVYSSAGAPLGRVETDFKDIEFIDVQTINGSTYISVIDGLENNVYLYHLGGRKLTEKSVEGSKKCLLSNTNGTLTLSTIVDDYIIQYNY